MKASLIDDEPLAVSHLRRLIKDTGRVKIAGSSSDPTRRFGQLRVSRPNVLFLEIQMPGTSGFDLLEKLRPPQPLVMFVTAYDRYALEAFKVNSIDYLLKPVTPQELERAIAKLERILGGRESRGRRRSLIGTVRAMLERREPEYLAARGVKNA
jgi:two-component system LytT family response regulator